MRAISTAVTSKLTRRDNEAIFRALVAGFRPDGQGRYRGAATHRGGDNDSAFVADVERGCWFDHVTHDGGDVVDFVRLALKVDFRTACRIISEIVGRDVLEHQAMATRPTHTQLARAELFSVGFRWRIERALELLKAGLECELLSDPKIICQLTRLLERVNSWSTYDAADFAKALRRTRRRWVAECIAEARETRIWLATILRLAGRNGAR